MTMERVKQCVSSTIGVRISDLSPETDLIREMGADSLDMIEIVMAIENEFDIHVPDKRLPKIRTVQDLADCVIKEPA